MGRIAWFVVVGPWHGHVFSHVCFGLLQIHKVLFVGRPGFEGFDGFGAGPYWEVCLLAGFPSRGCEEVVAVGGQLVWELGVPTEDSHRW